MSNLTQTAPVATATKNNEALVIVFQNFNGVFLAKISNQKDRETFAYGENRCSAELNALRNYRTKYQSV